MNQFLERVVVDTAAAFGGLGTALGGRLGLYAAMASAGPVTAADLADRTGLNQRYVLEWLHLQVASEYVTYDRDTDRYLLPDEHAAVLADAESPVYAIGSFLMLSALYGIEDNLAEAFRTGGGVDWRDHASGLFEGVAAFFKPGYQANLVSVWLPALDGVVAKLERGASVADVGCGFGHSTVLMAQAFPRARCHGFDFHAPSIEAASRLAAEKGLSDQVRFAVASANDFPGDGYDLITLFDCLHDLGDARGALVRVANALSPDGTCLIVEPGASANVLDNVNPIGRAFMATSVALCLPTSLAQDGGAALGNHAGEEKLRLLAKDAGLSRWRRVVDSPVNRVYEVKR